MKNSYPLPDSILGFLTRNWAGLCVVHRVGLSQGLVGVIWAPDFGMFVISPVQWPSGLVQNVWTGGFGHRPSPAHTVYMALLYQ